MARYFEVISKYAELPKEERVQLPKRQTANSAGYDFYALEDVFIPVGKSWNFRTGIKVKMPIDEHLEIHIRSSYGMKYGLRLANGVGIIDADYYNNPDNEGEIFLQIYNLSPFNIQIKEGEAIGQGIILPYGVTEDDVSTGERTGGFGSTNV